MFNQVDPTGGLSQQAIPAFTQNNDRAAQMANAGADRAHRSKEGALDRNQRGQEHEQNIQMQQQQMDLQKKQHAETMELNNLDMRSKLTMDKLRIQQENAMRKHAAESLKGGVNRLADPNNLAQAVEARKQRKALENQYALFNMFSTNLRTNMNMREGPDGKMSQAGAMLSKMVAATVTAKKHAADAALNALRDQLVTDSFGKMKSKSNQMLVDEKDPNLVHVMLTNRGDEKDAKFERTPSGELIIRRKDESGFGYQFYKKNYENMYNTIPMNELSDEEQANLTEDMSPLAQVFGSYLTTQSVENAAKPEVLDALVTGLNMMAKGNKDAGFGMLKGAISDLAKSKDDNGKEIGERAVRDMVGEALAITKDFMSREKPLASAAMNSVNLDALQNGESLQDFVKLQTDNTPSAKQFTRRNELGALIHQMGQAAAGLQDDEGNFYLDAYHNGTFQLGGSALANIPQAKIAVQMFQMLSNEPDLVSFAEKMSKMGPEGDARMISDNPQFLALWNQIEPEQRNTVREIAMSVVSQAVSEHNIDFNKFRGRDEDSYLDELAGLDLKSANLENQREQNVINNAPSMPDTDTSALDDILKQIPGGL